LVLIWTFLVVAKLGFRRGEKDDVLKLPQKKKKCGKLHINAVKKFAEGASVLKRSDYNQKIQSDANLEAATCSRA